MTHALDIISRILIACALLWVFTTESFAESPVSRMSRLQLTIKENPYDISALSESGRIYLDLYDFDGARRMASRLEQAAFRNPDSISALFQSRLLSGCADAMEGRFDNAVSKLESALTIAKSRDMAEGESLANNALAFCYITFDRDFILGLEYYKRAMEAAKEAKSDNMTIVVLNNLADAYLWRHDLSGRRFAAEALSLSKDNRNAYGELMATLTLAHYDCFTGKVSQVPALLHNAKVIHAKSGFIPQAEVDIVEARYHIATKDYEGAIKIIDRAINGSQAVLSANVHIRLLIYKAWASISMDNYPQAVATLTEADDLIRETGFNTYSLQVLSGLAYCYEHLGDTARALSFLRGYSHRMDSLWLSEQYSKLNKYRVDNEALLNNMQIQRQESQLNARMKYIVILISVGILLVIVVLTLVYLYRRKERLVRSVVARENESILREKMLRQALEQAKNELAMATTGNDHGPAGMGEDKIEDLMMRFNELMTGRRLYTDPGISLTGIAEMLDTNRTYLSRAINVTFGKSFPQVLAEYRVRASVEYLADPDCDMPLKEIATKVGFSSASVFSNTFRGIMGMTPAVYRSCNSGMDRVDFP